MVKTYTATFAIAFCEGPVPGIARIWMNSKIIADWRDPDGPYYPTGDIALASINLETTIARSIAFFSAHLGSETQTPDPALIVLLTEPDTPAYRGLFYVVFKDFPIGEFSGVPNIEVEVGQVNEIVSSGYFDNTKWDPLLDYAIWATDHWASDSQPGMVGLQEKSSWVEGFRPVSCRVTINLQSSSSAIDIYLFDTNDNGIGWIEEMSLASGVHSFQFDINFTAGLNIATLQIQTWDNAEFTITNIEFL
jgi:hypothetical protein